MNDFQVNPLEIIKKSKASTFIIYSNMDYLPKIDNKLTSLELESVWRRNFNELFKKSPYLVNALSSFEGKKYNSIHTRFTSLMGDFIDTTKQILTIEKKIELLDKLKARVEEIVSQSKHECFVFSDSEHFLKFIGENSKVQIVGGAPKHMDKFDEDTTLESHLKTILDFFLIANSQGIIFLRIDPMYHSSFSKYASIMGNAPFKTVMK
ncbi:hypothetical protein KXJ69_06280 [Aureisphaera sp. CAU 1614]|uniref:Uncharacterized protein n=1 Tax=Halomarinibacterium sedimenti TaxID=2857106 RepID=A0A9X1FND7_9FLAO|nr:hypothetical protein [Halomarinibacterium sedimenti]MBW2937706.1 hypothetical protein [Halomarinibacterium sedimenti]